ncbi:MAG: hypothetical protein AAGG11_24130, partial [Pseudomonadota bacterium]
MADYYLRAGATGSGAANPTFPNLPFWGDLDGWAGLNANPGDRLFIHEDSDPIYVYNGNNRTNSKFNPSGTNASGAGIEVWRDPTTPSGNRPWIDGSQLNNSGWADNGDTTWQKQLGGRSGNVVLRHRVTGVLTILNFYASDKRAQLAAADAGWMHDNINGLLSIKLPGGLNPNTQTTYDIRVSIIGMAVEINSGSRADGFTIRGVGFQCFSLQGCNFSNVTKFVIDDVHARFTGGDVNASWPVGGGFQCTGDCDGILYVDCIAEN